MIIKALIDIIYTVFSVLTLPIEIPSMPDSIKTILATALDYMTSGIAFVTQFFDMEYLLTLFSFIILIDGSILIYKLVMWVIKKVPLLGIE